MVTTNAQPNRSKASRAANGKRPLRIVLAIFVLAALVLSALCAPALAAAPPPLWKKGQNCGTFIECGFKAEKAKSGLKLVETTIPRGIASDPETGHLYVADQNNQRIVELTAWGDFVKAWGWGVKDGSPELQTCSAESGCLQGKSGGGKGQFAESSAGGVAVDSAGGIYVVDIQNHRVQKFDREGHFVLMLGGDVNKTKVEALAPEAQRNRCPVDPGDVCQAATTGAGNGQFSPWPVSSYIAVGPGDTIYVGDKARIEKFDSSGAYLSQIPLPEKNEKGEALPAPASAEVGALAVDPLTGFLYYAYRNGVNLDFKEAKHNVFKLDPATGKVVKTLEVGIPKALATDGQGGVYVFDQRAIGANSEPGNHITRVLKFNSAGNFVEVVAQNKEPSVENEFNESTGIATGSACYSKGFGFYVTNWDEKNSFIRAYGQNPDPALCPPPELAPSIDAQYAVSADTDGAILKALVNPHFWPDTTYYLEYGAAPCSLGGCAKQPAPPGSLLGGGAVEADVTTAGVFLSGLAPNTTYHYRFVAQSGGGGPVIGMGASESEVGEEATFTTFPPAEAPNTGCPNQGFRGGASAALADCRAYEMVSPLDKEGGEIATRIAFSVFRARLNQSSLSGDWITYSSYRPFAGPLSAPFTSQYLARRDPAAGWASESISAPKEGVDFLTYSQIESLYKAFSPELDTSWNWTNSEPVLGPGGQPKVPNIYRRDNGAGTYEACTSAEPTEKEKQGAEPQGMTPDQRHAVFRSQGRLTEDAAAGAKFQLYMCSFPEGGGPASVTLISVLPNGTPSALDNQAGSPAFASYALDRGHASNLAGAVSEDGARVFWTAGTTDAPGTIYLRLNATSAPTASGECSEAEPAGACTIAVSGTATAQRSRFWGATADGGEALFEVNGGAEKGDLYLFDTAKAIAEEAPDTLLAHKSKGVLGFSKDLSRIYFVSEEALGGGAVAGKANLYLYEGGEAPSTAYIATLSAADISANGGAIADSVPSPVNERPDQHTSRVSPDGATLAFMSNSAALAQTVAGYDNTDQASGEPDAEIYRYSTQTDEVACVSCSRSGGRPSGRKLASKTSANPDIWAAALLPSWETSLDPLHPLSEDGRRIFFESFEALVLADTNGKADVYQWEQAGSGDCKEGLASYVPASGGCISLISSGKSPADSEFIDASPTGRDAFFTTAASLLTQDPGSVDLYDARAGGGLPAPPGGPPACEGEACQGPSAAPNDPTPASATFHGAGNANEGHTRRCARGKALRRGRCVAKKHKRKAQRQRKADHKRGAGR